MHGTHACDMNCIARPSMSGGQTLHMKAWWQMVLDSLSDEQLGAPADLPMSFSDVRVQRRCHCMKREVARKDSPQGAFLAAVQPRVQHNTALHASKSLADGCLLFSGCVCGAGRTATRLLYPRSPLP